VEKLAAMADAAARAAVAGGDIVRGAAVPESGVLKGGAGSGDYVTEVDVASERAIREALSATAVPVLGEESGGPSVEAGGRFWVVDPLDGTTNFLHRFPVVGVSVALVDDGDPVVGVVHAPFLGRTWRAWRGGGAWGDRGRAPLRVSARTPGAAVVGTGFPFRRKSNVPRYVAAFRAAFSRFEDLRRPGAAALDLAWVAEGVFDGFFELGLGTWDVAAGAALVREAGGVVTDWAGDAGAWLRSGDVLAGPEKVHAALLEVARASAGADEA